jgi:hypothetical protein
LSSANTTYISFVKRNLAAFILNPITGLFFNAAALYSTLRSCRIFFNGSWSDLSGFTWSGSLVTFFYKTQAKAFQTVGYGGSSQHLGLGLPMTRFWYQSMLSVTLYTALGGALSRVIGMAVWLLSMMVWLSSSAVSAVAVLITLVATVLSSNFYGNCFDRQNYNVYGWALLPIVFWGLITGNIWLSLIFTTLIAVLSVTVFVFVCILVLSVFIITKGGYVFLTPLCGMIFYLFKIKRLFWVPESVASGQDFLKAVSKLLEFVSGHGDALLRRPSRWLASIALTSFLLPFPVAVYFSGASLAAVNNAELTFISLVPVCLAFLNQSRLFRFADVQSVLMFFLTVSSGVTLLCNHPLVFLAFYFSNTNGIISMVLFGNDKTNESNPFAATPVAPISTAKVQRNVEEFLKPVPVGERVLCVFRDPCGNYNNLFSGQYPLTEVLYHSGQITGNPVFPDFYLAMSRESGLRWGEGGIESNLDQFSTDYFILTEASPSLEKNENFTLLGQLSWGKVFAGQGGVASLPDPLPNWILMKRKKDPPKGRNEND